MRERYRETWITSGLLFLVSAVGGLLGGGPLSDHTTKVGFTVFGLTGLIMVVATYLWSRRYPLARVVPDVLVAVTIACVLGVLLVPIISEITAKGHWRWAPTNPAYGGAGVFFAKIWFFYGVGLVGALIGWMIAVALGQDHRAKALKQFTKTVAAKPHRPVRR
jgi:hypothetical protein